MSVFIRSTPYTGPVQAVVLDWAGTAVDYGSAGPVAVFIEVFSRQGVEVSSAEARKPMGIMKRDHIAAMCADPSVLEKWREEKGRDPMEADIDAMYAETERLMVACIARHSDPVPGLLDAIAVFRSMNIKIGSCTGYTAPMMDVLAPEAAQKGYVPDSIVSSSDVPKGRPYPWMCLQNAINLEVYPMESMVKIGDSVSDVHEGLNAGMWTIGLTKSGNEMGLTLSEILAIPSPELEKRLQCNGQKFLDAGAHYIAESIVECPDIIRGINKRLARGETPAPN